MRKKSHTNVPTVPNALSKMLISKSMFSILMQVKNHINAPTVDGEAPQDLAGADFVGPTF